MWQHTEKLFGLIFFSIIFVMVVNGKDNYSIFMMSFFLVEF